MMKDLNDFQLPEEKWQEESIISQPPHAFKKGWKNHLIKIHTHFYRLVEKRFGSHSEITQFLARFSFKNEPDEMADALLRFKKSKSFTDRLISGFSLVLALFLLVTWKSTLPMLRKVDQLKNDVYEQDQLIEMEQKNKAYLQTLAGDQETLSSNIQTVYSALPNGDEKAEEMISMLENIAAGNRMVIDGIGIRKLSESQINYDDLIGMVDVYEYTFSLESQFQNISSFIRDVRSSLRLMDIMAMEIEENKGVYRANFILYAYHLTP